jgi:hypothetical protein
MPVFLWNRQVEIELPGGGCGQLGSPSAGIDATSTPSRGDGVLAAALVLQLEFHGGARATSRKVGRSSCRRAPSRRWVLRSAQIGRAVIVTLPLKDTGGAVSPVEVA